MQREDSSCSSSSSFTSSSDMEAQEALLIEKYGALKLRQGIAFGKRPSNTHRKYFDSADWSLQKQGKYVPDPVLLDFLPLDQLPVKSEPTVAPPRQRSHLDAVGWAEPAALPATLQARNVMDI